MRLVPTPELSHRTRDLAASHERAKALAEDAEARERLTRKREAIAPTSAAEFCKKYLSRAH